MKPPKQTKQQYQSLITSTTNLLVSPPTVTTQSPTAKGDAYVSSIRSLLSSLPYQERIEVCGKTGDKGQDIRIEGNRKTLIIQAKLDKSHSGPEGIRGEISKVVNGGLLKQGDATVFCYVTNNEIPSDIVEKVKVGLAEDRKWVDLRVFQVRNEDFKDKTVEKNPSELELVELVKSVLAWPVTLTPVSNGTWRDSRTQYIAFFKVAELSKLNELAKKENYGTKLFGDNPRGGLGLGNKVNKEILRTLCEEPDRFCARNMGPTITCNKLAAVDANGAITISIADEPQVVNGAQSWHCFIHESVTAQNASIAEVAVTFVFEPDSEKRKDVSKCRNYSTPVKGLHVVWNDDEVKLLCKAFEERYSLPLAPNTAKGPLSAQQLNTVLISLKKPGIASDLCNGGNACGRATKLRDELIQLSTDDALRQLKCAIELNTVVTHVLELYATKLSEEKEVPQSEEVKSKRKNHKALIKQSAFMLTYAIGHSLGFDVNNATTSLEKMIHWLKTDPRRSKLQQALVDDFLYPYMNGSQENLMQEAAYSAEKGVSGIMKLDSFLTGTNTSPRAISYPNFCLRMMLIKSNLKL